MSYSVKSGGTVRTKKTIDGKRVDVVTACCEACRVQMHDSGRTAPEARQLAQKRGWFVTMLRQRTSFGAETRVWKVLCVNCRPKKSPEV